MANQSLFSPMWYRVADLRPRLRAHVRLHRQHYRGDLWYVVQDSASGRFYRFPAAAHALIGLMDGQRRMQEIWELAGERLGDGLPSQEDTIKLLSQLHAADMLHGDSVPDVEEVADRAAQQRRQKILQSLRNPLAVRFPLLDPDRFLDATLWMVRPIFGSVGLALWLAVVAFGVALAALHWSELAQNAYDRVLAADNLLVLALTYPLIKALHELGHGYAVKRWGGEVHELGLMLIVFMPVPYVDASSASAFQDKRWRMIVGAAGIIVELFLAALAMIAWVSVEPGLVRALAFNTMLIGGVSTLLFNGNPLLRFDGYYVLADLLEIPNLGQRASQYVLYLARRYLFGLETTVSPVTAAGERRWLLGYAVGAFCYRILVMVGIVLLLAGSYFFVGVMLALWAGALMALAPLWKMLSYLFTSPELARRRGRALAASAAIGVGAALLLAAVPVPSATVTEGVVWVPERSRIYAPADGFVADLLTPPGADAAPDQKLIQLADPILAAEADVVAAQLNEFRIRLGAEQLVDPVRAAITQEQIRQAEAELARFRERLDSMTVRSGASGRFVPLTDDLPGRFVRRGTLLGYVLDPQDPTIRVVLFQDDIDHVRQATRSVELRIASRPLGAIEARIVRITPQATDELPSPALSTAAGGPVPPDPRDGEGRRALESVFLVDLKPVDAMTLQTFGTRVYARFDLGAESLARQFYREARQLFLRQFDL